MPWPLWVSVGLWGLPGRGWAWACFWLSIAVAVGCVAYGFVFWPAFLGGGSTTITAVMTKNVSRDMSSL